MLGRAVRGLAVLLACAGLAMLVRPSTASRPVAAPAQLRPVVVGHTVPAHRGCRSGLVALTFDDGPRLGTTAALVRTLRAHDVPATFFQLGNHATAHPRLVRLVEDAGFTIGNHSWDHPLLPRLRTPAVRSELARTDFALRALGVPPSHLMRPPYGGLDPRVRAVVRRLGLTPVLWTIDSEDWRGGNAHQVAGRVLRALRPRATNVVLQHDGVTNSWSTVHAMPEIIRTARARGYCFARLGPHGTPSTPVPSVVVRAEPGLERARNAVLLRIRLTQPTTRPVSLRLESVDDTGAGAARGGVDYTAFAVTVRFARGTTLAAVRVPVVDDRVREGSERFRVRLSHPQNLSLTARTLDVSIRDDER